ncbi:MAG: RNA-directed DNA polymerase [Gammaproteobacteria bacterium]|nr:MAG: RNA-directed DNA polymerase [Gammaproteobacteria bacterium]
MRKVIDLSCEEARAYFLKGSSYFNSDVPPYISFEPILTEVASILGSDGFNGFKSSNPNDLLGVNYGLLANKDGRFAWRPLELIHPAIYVSLVNLICDADNWATLQKRFSDFENGIVECCSIPVVADSDEKDVAAQIRSWWVNVEQRSLVYSLEFSHILHTDVVNCYGSLYTHSIPWAIHGIRESKERKRDKSLLGNRIDAHIQAGRYGQTNGISQGSVLMDFIAELVLGFVDEQINMELGGSTDFRILRYRDDYRIFANSDDRVEEILKVVSQKLMLVGMNLGVSKTLLSRNVVEGSIKQDKLAGIDLQDLGDANAKTVQKQLLRLHSFGRRFPNSGALRRLVSEFHRKIAAQTEKPDDLEVQIAIATDIGFVSPSTFPAIAGILSHLISLASEEEKPRLWGKVRDKMKRVPHNGYLELWLQRVIQPLGIPFDSDEPICQIVNGESVELWKNDWIASKDLMTALDTSKIVVKPIAEVEEVIKPEEIEIFTQRAWAY